MNAIEVAKHLTLLMALSCATAGSGLAREYHVSVSGDDTNDGTSATMLRTISAAAERAQPGDVILVHEGVYRERVNPPRGGLSDDQRIVYQAVPGETVAIKGSEVIKGWEKVEHDTWKVTLDDELFGDFNPFHDAIRGDWFGPKGRSHHTGAVYLDGHWLTKAVTLEEVLQPVGETPLWFTPTIDAGYLLNVAWFSPRSVAAEAVRVPAAGHAAQQGIQSAPCSEGGDCIGWIEGGDWARYEGVDFGGGADRIEIRAASPAGGGRIELRLDAPDGKLLGACAVTNTSDWQKWETFTAKIEPTRGVQTLCLVFLPHVADHEKTTIWAQFPGVDPNEAEVEVNVRQSVFYPDKTGVNYLTVRGFTLQHAATNWAPPTAEQVGLIGTHWSKGWIIENNDIAYSTCVGVTLGKHGDEWDNTSANTAQGYVLTIKRGLERGWSKEKIGSHVVRNNHIHDCEQAGIVGSLGGVFSTISGNVIHDIHIRQLFTGAEQAGIKIHAAVDMEIRDNHIYRTNRGIWLDWMAEGAHVTRNLLHDNGPSEDIFVEVNHGPFLIENNICLSARSLLDVSEGGAYAHNLFAGEIRTFNEMNRDTPYLDPHATSVAGYEPTQGGDDRFYNNIFTHVSGLAVYDGVKLPMWMEGNVFLDGAKPSKDEKEPLVIGELDPDFRLIEEEGSYQLALTIDERLRTGRARPLVTTELLGKAKIPGVPYVKGDGTAYRLTRDYFGKPRDEKNPFPGPFELKAAGRVALEVWPLP